MTLEVRADTATIIVERELRTHINLKEGGSLLVKDVLAHKILESLGLKRASVWNGTDLESEEKEIYFKVKSERLEIQLKGAFFTLNKDWLGKLNQVLGVIKAEKLDYHFSRFDLLYITRENLFKELRRSQFKADPDIKYSKDWEPYWFRVFSTVLGVVYYDKIRQVQKLKKKSPTYFNHYSEKYGLDGPLYHLELRQLLFRRKDKNITTELVPSSSEYPFNFSKVRQEIEGNVLSRVKFHRKIKKLIKEAK